MIKICNLTELLGETVQRISLVHTTSGVEEMHFFTSDREFKLYHIQDCCEWVCLDEIVGDLKDIVGKPLLLVEKVSNKANDIPKECTPDESFTWTFYKFSTNMGSVTLRWYGTSNGFYSEEVNFAEIITEGEMSP